MSDKIVGDFPLIIVYIKTLVDILLQNWGSENSQNFCFKIFPPLL